MKRWVLFFSTAFSFYSLSAQSYIEKLEIINLQYKIDPEKSIGQLDTIVGFVGDEVDDFATSKALNLKGNCYAELGNRDTSLIFFKQAQRICRLNKDTFGLIKSWLSFAGSHLEFSAYLQAYALIDSSNILALQLKDTSLIIESLLSRAKLSYYKDEYNEAYKWLNLGVNRIDPFSFSFFCPFINHPNKDTPNFPFL